MSREIGIGLDLEGPMVDLEREGHHAAHLRAAETVGVILTPDEAIEVIPHLIGGPPRAIADEIYLLSNKTLPPERIHGLSVRFFGDWLREVKVVPVRQGLFEKLDEMRLREIPNVIGTATEKELVAIYLIRSGLAEYFDPDDPNQVVTAGPNIRTKPAPDIYLETARIMRIKPSQQIVIEDSPRGVKSGVAAGSVVIGLPVYFIERTIKPLQEAGAIRVYKEWQEINFDVLSALTFYAST